MRGKNNIPMNRQTLSVESSLKHEATFASKGKILLIGLQIGLTILVSWSFELQPAAFLDVWLLILIGFLIHAFLPLRLRLPFFVLLSLASIFIVFGIADGVWLIGVGLLLIGICVLPVSLSARVVLLVLTALLLASLRVEWISAPWTRTVWPILSSMFMFRLIIYLYDIQHEKGRPDLTRTLAYFFMLPNVCFPLFPVVDYKKFNKHYYNGAPERIYQRGVTWIFRGIVHLMLYRLVYKYLTVDPATVSGLDGVLQFSFAAFLLYLQVSGSFHMIVGILLLFGFNLPETNHWYFLASNFNDFWRRINIYWKDFMMKLFYYPVYFRVKRWGETKAIVVATFVVFFATWFLHAYQWFWIRGAFLFEVHDVLYWSVLAALVVGNSLYEYRRGRDRSLGTAKRSLVEYAALTCSTLGTFLTIGLLWGMWSSDSLYQWLSMWSTTGSGGIMVAALLPTLFLLSWTLAQFAKKRSSQIKISVPRRKAARPSAGVWRKGAAYAAVMCVSLAAAHEAVYSHLPRSAAAVVGAVRSVQLSARDRAQLEQGYYENLISVNRHSTEMWGLLAEEPDDWRLGDEWDRYWKPTGDLRLWKMPANVEFTHKRSKVSSNRWGMRDQNYDLEKPPNTIRIALLGASHVWGSGVNNDEIFEALLESRLNAKSDGMRYQILNFAHPGRDALNQVSVLHIDALPFAPDVVFLIENAGAARRLIRNFAKIVVEGRDIPYAYLASVIEQAQVNEDMPLDVAHSRLAPYAEKVLLWCYKSIVAESREHGVKPVWIYLPLTYQSISEEEVLNEESLAAEAGFDVISLAGAYDGYSTKQLALAEWDKHPNALAHRLLADRLYEILSEPDTGILRQAMNAKPDAAE
jgi:hypothetical protein